ncbi:MAG TPA: PDZ domain-containing protein [Acidobacteriaceae bacterium]|nr:PDZ domain-containing protein [Acidobacteriaceae bacterium]
MMKHFLRPYEEIKRAHWLACRRLVVAVVAGGMLAGAAGAYSQGLQISGAWMRTRLLLHGRSQGLLGVYVGDVDQERAQTLHLKAMHGAEITILDHDAPASKAGLKLHDVIVQMNGETIENAEQVRHMLRDTPPGKKVLLVISRDGGELNFTVQMADRRKVQEEAWNELGTMGAANTPVQGFLGGNSAPAGGGFHMPFFGSSLHVGVMVEPLTAQMADFLGVTGGVMIKSVAHKSAADAAGLRAHDVILEVAGEQVATQSDWERLLRASDGKPVQVAIFRDRSKQLVLLQVDGKRH